MPRRSAADAASTRAAILDRAVHVASTDGLQGLTIGTLAGDLRMSKSGLIGHFGSKEELQLAALDQAIGVFLREVWKPVARHEPGRARLTALMERWIRHLGRPPFPGGCFLTAAAAEFDGREGPVRDRIRTALRDWDRVLRDEAAAAGCDDPPQVAFELLSIAVGLNQALQLHGDRRAPARARKAVARLLADVSPT